MIDLPLNTTSAQRKVEGLQSDFLFQTWLAWDGSVQKNRIYPSGTLKRGKMQEISPGILVIFGIFCGSGISITPGQSARRACDSEPRIIGLHCLHGMPVFALFPVLRSRSMSVFLEAMSVSLGGSLHARCVGLAFGTFEDSNRVSWDASSMVPCCCGKASKRDTVD